MWRQLEDYPNYEINSDNGYVRNINTGKQLKERNMFGVTHVTIKHNGSLRHLRVCYLMTYTFTIDEIINYLNI
jgi:hypothetical protein